MEGKMTAKNKKLIIISAICVVAIVLISVLVPFILVRTGVISTGGGVSSTAYDVVKQTKRDNFTLLNERAVTGANVFIGDSIIELFPVSELFEGVSYNRGISGDTSDRLYERIEQNALNIAPKNLVILIGTNDLNRFSKDATIENIKKSVALAREKSPTTKVIISAILPVRASMNTSMVGGRKNDVIRSINEQLKQFANGADEKIVFADVFDGMSAEDGQIVKEFSYDGLHPNVKGFVKYAELLKPYMD